MAYIPRSSLIPNEASGAIPVQMKRRRTIHAFGLIATLIFIASLLSAVGVFLYKDYLEKQLVVAEEGLGSLSSEDNERKIEEIKLYDDKLRIARSLLENHISPVSLFEEIEESTKKTIQFDSLDFVYDPGFEAVLTLHGNTETFTSVALQKMQILEDKIFSDFALRNVTTGETESSSEEGASSKGEITFSVTGIFEKGILEYDASARQATQRVVPEPIPNTEPEESADASDDIPLTQTTP